MNESFYLARKMADTELVVTDRYSIHRNLATVYGTFIVSLGIAFPLTAAFARGSGFNDAFYVEVFNGYLYLSSVAALLYVFLYLLRGSKDNIKKSNGHQKPADIPLEPTNGSENGHKCSPLDGATTSLSAKVSYDKPRVHYGGEGITLYLRIAAVVFAIGALLYDGFSIAEYVQEKVYGCVSHVPIVSSAIHCLFLTVQTVFIVRYHKIVVTAKTRLANKVFMHLMVTNICVFFAYSAMDTAEDFGESSKDSEENSTETSETTEAKCGSIKTIFDQASPYLYPFVLEYSVIGATLMYIIFTSIGAPAENSSEEHEGRRAMKTSFKHSWQRPSSIGALLGVFVAMVTFAVLVYFLISLNNGENSESENSELVYSLYLFLEIVLLLVNSITVLVALRYMRSVVYLGMETDTVDDNLLFMATFGAYLQYTFISMPNIWYISQGYPDQLNAILALLLVVLGLVQATLQTAFLADNDRRDPEVIPSGRSVVHAKGRGLLVFLIICNLSLWLCNTFGLKKAEEHKLFHLFYGELPWKIVHNLTAPIIIFFRIHSAAVMSVCWTKAHEKQDLLWD